MPTFAYGIIGVVVVVMLLVMVLGMRKSFARARNTTDQMYSGLERLGLKVVSQEGAKLRLAGTYGGWQLVMESDGSAIMNAAGVSMFEGALVSVGISAGPSWRDDQWTSTWVERRARSRMQNAPMRFRWQVVLPGPSPVRCFITRDQEEGAVAIGSGLFAHADPTAQAALSNPAMVNTLASAQFDCVRLSGGVVDVIWMPPMREYQQHVSSPEKFTATIEAVLRAATLLCETLFGRPGGPMPAHMQPSTDGQPPGRFLAETMRSNSTPPGGGPSPRV